MTKYENMLRGGPPGAETRGMVLGSVMSLALGLVILGLRIGFDDVYANRESGPAGRMTPRGYLLEALSVLYTPVRDLLWAVPAFVLTTRRRALAIRNGLGIALVLTVIGFLAVGPIWGPIGAMAICLVARGADEARIRSRSTTELRRSHRPVPPRRDQTGPPS